MNYSYRKYPKIGGSKISGRQDPRQSHHLPQLVLGTQEIGGWKPQMLKNWRKTVMKTVSDFADWYDWNWKKNMSDFMIETMLKKLQCFSSFFRIKLWLKNYGIIPLRSRPKMLMGRPWKDTAFFHDGFVMDTAVITRKLWLKYLKLYFFFTNSPIKSLGF
jgi:hypothetical protein